MTDFLSKPCTAFDGHRLLLAGPLIEVALAVKTAAERDPTCAFLVFDDKTGRVFDLDLRGTKADVIGRLSARGANDQVKVKPTSTLGVSSDADTEARGRGRPKLGVIGREVTLLPRHWDWLNTQPGGASVALRKLVEAASRTGGDRQRTREAQEVAYRVMSALAGNLPGFEEATRALFADNRAGFDEQVAEWPQDVRNYATQLAFGWQAPG